MGYKSVVILTLVILSLQESTAQKPPIDGMANYKRIDTVRVNGYCIRRFDKAEVLTMKDAKQFWLTTRINGWEVFYGEYNYIQDYVVENNYENLEFYLFSPIPTADVKIIPELAKSQERVDIPSIYLYTKAGDDEHLYSIFEVKGMAERYIVRPEFISTLEIGKDISPPLTMRVPYVFMYFFRWADKVTINKEVSLNGFSMLLK